MRLLDFSDGFTSATEPLQGNVTANALKVFASDADFVTDKGSAAAQGDVYSRSSDDVIRYHDGSAWVSLASTAAVDSAIAVHTGDTTDAHAGTAITNTPSGNLAATTVQAALNELQTDVDTRATSAALSSHESDTTSIHGITDTSLLLTTTGAQVVTAKDIDGGTASNTSRITIPKASKATLDALTRKEATVVYASDTDKLYYDDGSVLKAVGSGSGNGINYITDSDAESGTGSWATYADAAASSPVDGTGGSPSSTWTTSTSSPLRGTASFLWTKSAANRQGEGFSYDFTIDASDKAKVLQISFDYLVSSGTYANSDMTIWIYDVTNAALIQPAGYTIQNVVGSMSQKATFQSASNSTSYRLIVHTASTSASAYTLQFDNFAVGPQIVTNGAAVTDWTAYTPTSQGFGTPTFDQCLWRQVGDSIEIQVEFTCGTTTASQARIGLPNGMTTNYSTTHVVGNAVRNNSTTNAVKFFTILAGANIDYILFSIPDYAGGNNSLSASNGNAFSTSGDIISLTAKVRINGKSSNVQLSSDTDTRVVAAKYIGNDSSSLSATPIVVKGGTKSFDTHGMINSATGAITIPVSGIYEFTVEAHINALSTAANQYFNFQLRTGSTANAGTIIDTAYQRIAAASVYANMVPITFTVNCLAGEVYSFQAVSDVGASRAFQNDGFISVKRLSGPSVIAASESVSFSANTSTTAGTTSQCFIYTSVDHNTHQAYSTVTGKFTAPISGKYCFQSTGYVGGSANFFLYKNSSSVIQGVGLTAGSPGIISHTISLLAGDVVEIRPGSSVTASGGAALNTFSGFRVGN